MEVGKAHACEAVGTKGDGVCSGMCARGKQAYRWGWKEGGVLLRSPLVACVLRQVLWNVINWLPWGRASAWETWASGQCRLGGPQETREMWRLCAHVTPVLPRERFCPQRPFGSVEGFFVFAAEGVVHLVGRGWGCC